MRLCFILALPLLLLFIACAGQPATSTPLPDIGATVEAAVADALPTDTPTTPPDVDATVTAGIAATIAADPTPSPTPEPTQDLEATVEARMAATAVAMPTPTPTPEPTATPVPTPTPTPTATPTPTPVPTSTPRPTATPRPTSTPTPRPTSTPTPTSPPAQLISEMVREARPSVVRIETTYSSGTGVIFETRGQTAYIVTNHHVVEGFGKVRVVVDDSDEYTGTVRGTDNVRDLAVVSICCGRFQSLAFGDASALEPGDEVVAIGYALGLSGQATITRGIVSAIRYDSYYRSDVIQTDAAINPGNSGGPMLSLSGEILGINTFKIDESESGRGAEGLGFAISENAVQARLTDLKTARAAPTATPTRQPTPTPLAGSGTGFGPISGELRHDPSDGFIKTEYAAVTLSDMIVRADFVNPYSASTNPWDYGFIIRQTGTGDTSRFVTVAVTSQGHWDVSWRQGSDSENQDIAEGTLRNFNTSSGGRNTVWIAALGGRGLFFVNGEFISMLDFSAVTGAGDIAVITGAFEGDELAGAVTRFEEFQILPLQRRYGPASGSLQKEPGFVAEHDSNVWTRDLVAQALCDNPPGGNWDCGFIFRAPDSRRLEVVGITGRGIWFHNSRDQGDDDYTDVADGLLSEVGAAITDSNLLILFAFEDIGLFFANGQFVARLELSHNQDFGDVSVMGDYYIDHNGSPTFSDFSVWTFQP